MKSRKWIWAIALLPMVCVSLVAQEPANEEAAQPAEQAPPPASEPSPAPSAAPEERPPDEELSVDNNLSFPVDI
jgi:hypothetical protein